MNPFADLVLLMALYQWYVKERPDIVHHFTIKPVIYGSIAAKLAGVPKIINTITGMGYVFTEEKVEFLRTVVKRLYQIALQLSHYTFFQNIDDYQYFVSNHLIKFKKTGLLPGSGVDCSFFSPEFFLCEANKDRLNVLMVSRLLKDKGIYEFIDAAKSIKETSPQINFQLLGGLDTRNPNVVPENELNQWIEQGIVEWLGEMNDVRPIIAAADLVVLPSYREGIPRALLEASSMCKPVITTDAVGCREVVDNEITGLIVPVRNSKKLAEAIRKILQNPEMGRQMGVAGRKKIKSEFDEKIVIDKTSQIYFQKQQFP
ncbi:glycosyl transferase family 1 [Desulfosarcina widdelii]|uniref:Glycosyl transferase family 1 n=2 Tax=Desulfosarcina widdelii TaxID=947919 RepID=A0A5K7Z213_9BACT|nr:glycosyl transferase family 1 [Desulfosarcina widdelii]